MHHLRNRRVERFTGLDYSRCFESIASRMCGKLAKLLSMMCWDMTFPEDELCSLPEMVPKSGGCNLFDQVHESRSHMQMLDCSWCCKFQNLSGKLQEDIVVVHLDVKKALNLQGVGCFTGISSYFHIDDGKGATWITRQKRAGWSTLYWFRLTMRTNVVLVVASVVAAEPMGTEVIAKLNKDVGLTVSAQKNTLDVLLEDGGQKHHGGWTEEVLEFV